ncbi:MAG: hypothetical protein CVU79_08780 [Elusimicrobia bacterium HGW-Elusimicrobia-3]|nr:MAG: hypothetical protein CVU79_08780 [Elusimicrobia bacterium HGW-Elusimicrobia-3]
MSTPPATAEVAYRPVNPRDPMIPSYVYGDLTGTGSLKTKSDVPAESVAKGTFTIHELTLTGIMVDSRGRQALLRDDAGNMYTLKAGRLNDSTKTNVPGVSGIVRGKQVTLMTRDKEVRRLTLGEKE